MRHNESGQRLCDSGECPNPAEFTSIHSIKIAYCSKHVENLLILAQRLGHPDPSSTIRPLSPTEKNPKG